MWIQPYAETKQGRLDTVVFGHPRQLRRYRWSWHRSGGPTSHRETGSGMVLWSKVDRGKYLTVSEIWDDCLSVWLLLRTNQPTELQYEATCRSVWHQPVTKAKDKHNTNTNNKNKGRGRRSWSACLSFLSVCCCRESTAWIHGCCTLTTFHPCALVAIHTLYVRCRLCFSLCFHRAISAQVQCCQICRPSRQS